MTPDTKKVAVVAIARNEEPFLDEWLLYHRLIGADHFFIYDDNIAPGLEEFLSPHKGYTTVIRWHDIHQNFSSLRSDRQTKAYTHAAEHLLTGYQWAAFIDIDEFIVLDKHRNLKEFIVSLKKTRIITLDWHIFGHNGHYENPTRPITSALTRRKLSPAKTWKCIARCDTIMGFGTPHLCKRTRGHRTEAGDSAHINHYMCRSFTNWMSRPDRGEACDVPLDPTNNWKRTKEGCLRRFVTDVALDWNEHVDEYMLKFKPELERAIRTINGTRKKRK